MILIPAELPHSKQASQEEVNSESYEATGFGGFSSTDSDGFIREDNATDNDACSSTKRRDSYDEHDKVITTLTHFLIK